MSNLGQVSKQDHINTTTPAKKEDVTIEKIDSQSLYETGQWYILNTDAAFYCESIPVDADFNKDDIQHSDRNLTKNIEGVTESCEVCDDDGNILVCVDEFKSNLIIFKSNQNLYRILNKDLSDAVTPIDNHKALNLIEKATTTSQRKVIETQEEIQALVNSANMTTTPRSDSTEVAIKDTNALKQHITSLQEVNGKGVMQLSENLKGYIRILSSVAKIQALPYLNNIMLSHRANKKMNNILHDVSLYGGLEEKVTQIASGGVACESTPIHIFQNKRYKDVEFFDDYSNINQQRNFYKWAAIPENRDRIFPTDKCIVGFREFFYKRSFYDVPNPHCLMMRNGENLYAIESNLNFGDELLTDFDYLNQDMYVRIDKFRPRFAKDRYKFISKNQFDEEIKTLNSLKREWLDFIERHAKAQIKVVQNLRDYLQNRKTYLPRKNWQDSILVKHPKGEDVDAVPLSQLLKTTLDDRWELGFYLRDIITPSKHKNDDWVKELIGCNKTPDDFYNFDENLLNKLLDKSKAYLEKIVATKQEFNSNPKIDITNWSGAVNDVWGLDIGTRSLETIFMAGEVGFIGKDGETYLYDKTKYDAKLVREKRQYFSNKKLFADSDDPSIAIKLLNEYQPLNDDFYFYDEVKDILFDKYKKQNELIVYLQGLLDRSVLMGYQNINLFDSSVFESNKIKLVYDKDLGVANKEMPDYESFISQCNKGSKVGDIFYGQAKLFAKQQQEKKENSNRYHETESIPSFLPAHKITKKRDGRIMVKFRVLKDRPYWSDAISKKVILFECELSKLINVSNYKQGDHLQFINDIRCRFKYPKWGDLIMSAEHYKQK